VRILAPARSRPDPRARLLAPPRLSRILDLMQRWVLAALAALALLAGVAVWWTGERAAASAASPVVRAAALPANGTAELEPASETAEPRAQRNPAEPLPIAAEARVEQVAAALASKDGDEEPTPGEALSGRVVDDLGAPVTAFTLHVRNDLLKSSFSRAIESATGSFELTGLTPGTWRVLLLNAEWQPSSKDERVELPQGEDELVLVCPRPVRVSGSVVTPDGAPAPGARIQVLVSGIDRAVSTSFEAAHDGSFDLEGLRPGALSLTASLTGYASSQPEAFDVPPGSAQEGLVLRLRDAGRIEGLLTTSAGAPVAGRDVFAARLPSGFAIGLGGSQATDAGGRFAFPDLAPGLYAISATLLPAECGRTDAPSEVREHVELSAGATATVHLGGIPPRPIEVWGEVRAGGRPLSGAIVEAMPEDDPALSFRVQACSGEDGVYTLEVPRPGNATFVVELRGTSVVRHARVPDEPRWRFDIELSDAHIAGRVVDREGRGLRDVSVQVEPDAAHARRFSHVAYALVETDEDGGFRFESLPEGVYSVWAGEPPPTGSVENHAAAASAMGRSSRHGLELKPGRSIDGIELTLSPEARVRGRLLSSDRSSIEYGSVVLRDAAGRVLARRELLPAQGGARFECSRLEGGTYYASAWAPPGRVTAQPVEIAVAPGETREVELELADGAFALVSLRDTAGVAIEPHVRALDARGWDAAEPLGAPAQTLEKRIGPLAPGAWRILADDGAGHGASAEIELVPGEMRTVALRLE
jgi:hypothetical protein